MVTRSVKEQEGAALQKLLAGVNYADFAKRHGLPGGASMLSQHLSGHRPINLNAARVYAKGLSVPIRSFSPRLAAEVDALQSTNAVPEQSIFDSLSRAGLDVREFPKDKSSCDLLPSWLVHATGKDRGFLPDLVVMRPDDTPLYIVVTARDSEMAARLKHARDQHQPHDLVILDAHDLPAAIDQVTAAIQRVETPVRIPLLPNGGSMGGGTDVLHDDVVIGALTVSPDWLARRIHPSSHDALRLIHAYGDSMHPTFEDGDVLLVDTGKRDPSGADGVYVLSTGSRVFIKRVTERFNGGHDVTSDNPTVKTMQDLNGDQHIDVLGRVVWVWNGRKL